MLAFTFKRRKQSPARPATAGRRLDLGLDQRPRVKKSRGAFDFIFKAEVSGVEVLHSRSPLAQHLARHSALGATSPELKAWLRRWMRGGGLVV